MNTIEITITSTDTLANGQRKIRAGRPSWKVTTNPSDRLAEALTHNLTGQTVTITLNDDNEIEDMKIKESWDTQEAWHFVGNNTEGIYKHALTLSRTGLKVFIARNIRSDWNHKISTKRIDYVQVYNTLHDM